MATEITAAAGGTTGTPALDAQTFGGVTSDETHAALRASVRRLGELLGEALTRHEGARPAGAGRAGAAPGPAAGRRRRAARRCSPRSTTPTAVVLARAFTAYFQLANITEQLHRWQELAARPRRAR